jgi:hypothetical protein
MEFLNHIVRECRFESFKKNEPREKLDDPVIAIHNALCNSKNTLYKLQSDENTLVCDIANFILEEIKKGIRFFE